MYGGKVRGWAKLCTCLMGNHEIANYLEVIHKILEAIYI